MVLQAASGNLITHISYYAPLSKKLQLAWPSLHKAGRFISRSFRRPFHECCYSDLLFTPFRLRQQVQKFALAEEREQLFERIKDQPYVSPFQEDVSFPNGQAQWYQLGLLFVLLSFILMVSGCSSTASKEIYRNSEFGISLEKPGKWSIEFYERSGSIVLEAEHGVWNKDSARIEIYGYACVPTWFQFTDEEIESNIERIRTLHNLDSITIIQEPTKSEIGDNEISKAIITIPTLSLPEDSAKNQVGDWSPGIIQMIEIFAIRDRKITP